MTATFGDLALPKPLARRLAYALGIASWLEAPDGPAYVETLTFRDLLCTPGIGPRCAIQIADRCAQIGHPIPDPDDTRHSPRIVTAERAIARELKIRIADAKRAQATTSIARRRAAIRGLYKLGALRIETDVGYMKLSDIAKMLERTI